MNPYIKFLSSLLLFGAISAQAATHYLVPPETPGAAPADPYTNWAMAGTSVIDVLNAAMSNSSTPRIIWVTNGVYVLTNIVTITNSATLKSINGRALTIFDGNATADTTNSFRLEHADSVLDGLTITNCYSFTGGGGVRIGGLASAAILTGGTITNCMIVNCRNGSSTGERRGGGIQITGTGIVANSIVRNNIGTNSGCAGGGIAINAGGYGIIKNCIIENNQQLSGDHGGGIYISGNSARATILNCMIAGNFCTGGTSYGAGIYTSSTNILVANCTIVSNNGSGLGSGIAFNSATGRTNFVVNCVIISNYTSNPSVIDRNIRDMQSPANQKAVYFSCATSNTYFILDGRGNTTNDPQFTDFQGGNYRFNRTSPCFNTGTNQDWMNGAFDLDGHARILHGMADMGAYELFIPSGAMFRGR